MLPTKRDLLPGYASGFDPSALHRTFLTPHGNRRITFEQGKYISQIYGFIQN